MTEQQYHVIADRASMADESWIAEGDRVTYGAVSSTGELVIVRIERPVPTTDEAKQMLMTHPHDGHGPNDTCRDCESVNHPSLPAREQIAEAIRNSDWDSLGDWEAEPERVKNDYRKNADAVLALLQKGADR